MHLLSGAILAVGLFASQTTVVEFDPSELVGEDHSVAFTSSDEELDVRFSGGRTYEKCAKVADNQLSLTAPLCRTDLLQFRAGSVIKDDEVVAVIHLANVDEGEGFLEVPHEGEGNTLAGGYEAIIDPIGTEGPRIISLSKQKLAESDANGLRNHEGGQVFAKLKDEKVWRPYTIRVLDPLQRITGDELDDETVPAPPRAFRCKPPPSFARHYVICLDAWEGRPKPVRLPPGGHVIRPNRPVLVMVRHPSDVDVSVEMNGAAGLYQPPVRNETNNELQSTRDRKAGEPKAPAAVVSEFSFAPRKPGDANLEVTLGRVVNGATVEAATTVELIVESTYGGAIRLGAAAVMGGAIDQTFAAKVVPGSRQAELVRTSGGAFDVELVLGFAPYLDYFEGGRSYASGEHLTRFPWGVSPYVGIGLLNQGDNGLETLKSLHLGLEWEPMPSFSIAATAVGRRVSRLEPGAFIGMPVDAGGVPTIQGYELGGAVVLNFSPDFLKLAVQPGSSFFE